MSRSGYVDDDDGALNLWRGAVNRALKGKRGQALLRELVMALDAMEDKRLYPGSFATAEGQFCTFGVLGARRGTKMDDLGDEDDCDPELVALRFGVAPAMAAEIMFLNDEHLVGTHKWIDVEICGPMRHHRPDWGNHIRRVQVYNDEHPKKRWEAMREWAVSKLKKTDEQMA